MSAPNRLPTTSRKCRTRTVISTVLPLPLAPTRPIIGLLESTKSIGSAVWHIGQARRLAGTAAGRGRSPGRTGQGRLKVGKVSSALPVNLILTSSSSFLHSMLPRPAH